MAPMRGAHALARSFHAVPASVPRSYPDVPHRRNADNNILRKEIRYTVVLALLPTDKGDQMVEESVRVMIRSVTGVAGWSVDD